MKLSDRPAAQRNEDLLGRWGLAKTIFDLIVETQGQSAVKIGVYGGWGEGKSSVLRFVEDQAVRAEIPVCWFSVWTAQTQSDLWGGLVDALRPLSSTIDWKTRSKRWASSILAKSKDVADANDVTKAAHALGRLVADQAPLAAEDVQMIVTRLGGLKRVIILVDDVDRVDPPLVPKLLMGLHELFDELEQCAIVVALDPDVISGALDKLNPAWSSGPDFLEKIIQYPFWLSQPNEAHLRRFVTNALHSSGLPFPQEAILDLWNLLPKNPRKIKQFIRGLERLRTTLARFEDDEWNPSLVILFDLMRNASPEAADRLLGDYDFVRSLVSGNVLMRTEERHEKGPLSNEQFARIENAVTVSHKRSDVETRGLVTRALTSIASKVLANGFLVSADDAVRHAAFDTQPPAMTLREFDRLHERWRSSQSAAHLKAALSEHADRTDLGQADVLEACASVALQKRGQLIEESFEALDQDTTAGLSSRAESILSLLEQLVEDLDALGDTVSLRVELFIGLRNQINRFANLLPDDVYTISRRRQREFLYRCATRLKDRAADVLQELNPWSELPEVPGVVGASEHEEVGSRLNDIFGNFVCEDLLDRFRRSGGVAALNNALTQRAELWLLFRENGLFHQPKWRAALVALAERKERIVGQNCFVYLHMLSGNRGFTRSPLVKDRGLIVPLWHAALSTGPQPRMAKLLKELGLTLRQGLEGTELIDIPEWLNAEVPAEDDSGGE